MNAIRVQSAVKNQINELVLFDTNSVFQIFISMYKYPVHYIRVCSICMIYFQALNSILNSHKFS